VVEVSRVAAAAAVTALLRHLRRRPRVHRRPLWFERLAAAKAADRVAVADSSSAVSCQLTFGYRSR
jgi:hypothetical protein